MDGRVSGWGNGSSEERVNKCLDGVKWVSLIGGLLTFL